MGVSTSTIFFPWRILMVVFLALAVGNGCGNSSDRIKNQGNNGPVVNWDQKVKQYQKDLAEHPNDTETKLALTRAREMASLLHTQKGQALLDQGMFSDAITEFQLGIALLPSNKKAGNLIEEAKKKKEAAYLVQQGHTFLKAQKNFQARESFKKALNLDPENESARKALNHFVAQSGIGDLQGLKLPQMPPASFKFKKTSIINVFEVVSRLTGMNFIFDKDMVESKVTLFMTDVTMSRFIEVLLQTNNLGAKIVDEKTMLIYPDTAAKAKEYESLKIRTFYLAHLEAKKAVGLLAKILKSKDIIANEKMNAIVIRGTEDVLEIASRIIEANDRAPSEVLLDVEILEVSRTKEKQLGLEINPTSVSFGVGETNETIDKDATFANNASIYALQEVSNKELMFSLPTATLHLLKQDGDTKTLANPQIRVKNQEKATIHIGERVPLRSNRRVDTTGNITYDYQYQDIGVKLESEPTINMNGEVSLKLSLEVSALGPNVGTADEPQYSIKTRTAKSVLTVTDGDPVIIGGLIGDEERETMRRIPFIGEIPVLGRLFSNQGKNDVTTDILMSITPVIIRNQEIPGRQVTQIWSGSENKFSLSEPYANRDQNKGLYRYRPEGQPETADKPAQGAVESGDSLKEKNTSQSAITATSSLNQDTENEKTVDAALNGKEERADVNEDVPHPDGSAYFWPESIAYSIHVDSIPVKKDALKRIAELESMHYACFMVRADVAGKGIYYRVFVGRFGDYASAKEACDAYRNRKEFASDIHVVDRRWAFGE